MPKTLFFFLRLTLGGFFIYSGLVKLRDLTAFTNDIANYQIELIQTPWDAYLAYFLPWLEIITGALLVLGIFSSGALLITAGLMAVFIVALASAWARGLDITCGCFGPSTDPVNYPLKISTNMAIMILSIIMLLFQPRHEAPED